MKKDENEKIIRLQSKLTIIGVHKHYTKYDSYAFKQNEVLMDKPIYLGFAIVELSIFLTYETYYDNIQPYFGEKKKRIQYLDTDSLVLSVSTKDILKDLKNFVDSLDFSKLNESHEVFSSKNRKVLGRYKTKTPKSISTDEFVALRSKCYAIKCGVDSKNKLKGISKSQTKVIKFEEKYNCLFGGKFQHECDNYLIR